MERNARIILVSAFLLVSIVGLYLFYLWIDASANQEYSEQRLIQFQGSVSGLSPGSEVRYLGVPVGRVESIMLNRDQAGRVDVMLGASQPLPPSANLIAILEGQGITGLSIIELRDRNGDFVDLGIPDQVIPGYPSVLSQLSDSAGSVTDSAALALVKINNFLSEKTIEDMQSSLKNLRQLSANLADASTDLGNITSSVNRVSQALEQTLPDYRAMAQRVSDEVVPAVVAAGNSLQQASDAISNGLGDDGAALQSILNKELPTLIGMSDELAKTLQQINQLVGNLNDEPGSLLFGEQVKEVEISRE